MRFRRWWWLLALSPALGGVVSMLSGVGDLRSSGLMLGVSTSLGLIAIVRLLRAPWRGRRGLSKWLAPMPGILLGAVALAGVTAGLPDFLQARGLVIEIDSVGPVAVLDHEGSLWIVGNDTTGGFAWTSDGGSDWKIVDNQAMTELEIADATAFGSTLVVVGQSAEAEGVVMVSEDGETFEEAGRFANSDFGTIPQAVSGFTELAVISEIYGNDVEFYSSKDARSWVVGQPSAVFDDGESARDIACSHQVCLGVGFLDSTYRQNLETSIGAAWMGPFGDTYHPVNYDFGAETLNAVAWNSTGFIVAGEDSDGEGLAWHSTDGERWEPLTGPFTGMSIDGVEAFEGLYLMFGHDATTASALVWTSEDTIEWSESVVSAALSSSTSIRSITSTRSGLVAAGIDGSTLGVLVWTSPTGTDWQKSAALPPR